MFIPVIKIKAILDVLIDYIRADYELVQSEEESFLYRIFEDAALGEFNFFEQSKNIFLRQSNSHRQIQTRMGFDLTQTLLPTIYVHQPNESLKGINTIGFGYDTNEFYSNSDGSQTDKLFRGFGSVFEYVITSPNILETVLIYEALHGALISAHDTLTENFNNFNFTGKELIARSEQMPDPIFIKSILIDIDYVKVVPRLIRREVVQFVEFNKATIYTSEAIGDELIDDSLVYLTDDSGNLLTDDQGKYIIEG